ncbi:IPExxxVDY family protein [Flavobacterium sp.]|uniref:IPExxxVDY family protein n=1 Tax=Flavobacterium sp. TaxID=239 RepID=UPI0026175A73|nr:IPExxxVDY family protein [Flavobacterium sp.]
MAIHKLQLEDFDQVDYNLIAIHTSLEDYKLAFKLNQNLSVLLSKNESEIPIKIQGKTAYFSRFTFDDEDKMTVWDLIQNKQEIELPVKTPTVNLFDNNSVTTPIALVSELKKVDYFLKIEHDAQCKIKDIISKINKIDSISTVYEVDANEIKSKNNLIF